jgi:hypothetical protein
MEQGEGGPIAAISLPVPSPSADAYAPVVCRQRPGGLADLLRDAPPAMGPRDHGMP